MSKGRLYEYILAFAGWWSIFREMVGSGGYTLAGGGWWWIYFGWWWVVVDIFWLVVGGGGHILAVVGSWWVVAQFSLTHIQGSFHSVRLVDQRRRLMEVILYSKYFIMGSGIGILARKIRLASYDWWWNHDLHTIAYFIVWIKCFSSEKHFSFLSVLVQVTHNTLIFIGNCIFQQSTI